MQWVCTVSSYLYSHVLGCDVHFIMERWFNWVPIYIYLGACAMSQIIAEEMCF